MTRNLLIEETPLVQLTLVEGAGAKGKTIARGEFGRVDVPTQNGRIYPTKLMEREISRLQNDLKSRRVTGHADHPENGKNSLGKISHVITDLRIKDGIVIGEAEILDTIPGKNLKVLIEAGIPIGVSSRGYGSTAPSQGQHEGEEVQEDFVLKTYDFVSDPAMKSAVPGIFNEDVDDKTMVEMLLQEFPDVAEELRSGSTVSEPDNLEEGLGTKGNRKDIEVQVRQEMSENFERELKAAMVSLREDVSSDLREEYDGDPSVGAAKGVLAAIADMVAAYHSTPDERAVRDAVKASELAVSEANVERDAATETAKRATYMLHVERQIASHPMAESIRAMLKGKDFESKEEADDVLAVIMKNLPESDSVMNKEEVKVREENAELRGEKALLESKVDQLNSKLLKAAKLGERIDEQRIQQVEEAESLMEEMKIQVDNAEASRLHTEREASSRISELELEVYKRDKVAKFSNGRELLGLMEGLTSEAQVDQLVVKGLTEMGDPNLRSMRASLGKGLTGTRVRLEEETSERAPRQKIEIDNGVSFDMGEMAMLSGIPQK